MNFQKKHNSDIANIELMKCLGNCSICNQGPYCTVNDFLFQEDSGESLNEFLNDLVARLRIALKEYNERKEKEI
jgi:NADH:ubiquinone oxidoreductase subunit E